MKQINCLKRNIYNDCRKAMAPAVICYALNDILGAIIGVYTAVVLGKFADAVFNLDISYGIANFIFHGSIKENIHIVNPKATEDEVSTVMKELAIHHLSDRVISFNQNDLSGGEKQKISLARALLKNTPVLFFDEPANNLDKESAIWLSNFIRESSNSAWTPI